MQVVYGETVTDNIDDLPGILRTSACVGPVFSLEVSSSAALKLARRIEQGAVVPEVRVVVRDVPMSPFDALYFCVILTMAANQLVSDAAKIVAGWL